MDVAVSVLRAELAEWIGRVRRGEEVVITEHGTPVARMTGVDSAPLIERLTAAGVIAGPRAGRPTARRETRVKATGSVSALVSAHRR